MFVLETFPNWNKICEDLKELSNIQSLKLDIMVLDREIDYPFDALSTFILMSVLKPLKDIHARVLEVEFNVDIPNELWELLAPVNFTTISKERPFNVEVFCTYILHDAIDIPWPFD